MIDPGYPALSAALSASMLWRAGAAVAEGIARAWPSSFVVTVSAPIRKTLDRSLIAWVVALGGALCLLLQPAIPEYVRPGLPRAWQAAAIVVAVIVAMNGRAIEEAWPHSRLARLFAHRRPQR